MCGCTGETAGVRTYTEVGLDGMEAGEREPRRCVRICWELRFETLRSREGVRLVEEVMCRRSVGGELVGGLPMLELAVVVVVEGVGSVGDVEGVGCKDGADRC